MMEMENRRFLLLECEDIGAWQYRSMILRESIENSPRLNLRNSNTYIIKMNEKVFVGRAILGHQNIDGFQMKDFSKGRWNFKALNIDIEDAVCRLGDSDVIAVDAQGNKNNLRLETFCI